MKKIGLVLAGGGGRGAYQIGVWKALRDTVLENYITSVSGTSVGGLNAALFVQNDLKVAQNVWESISKDQILTSKSDSNRSSKHFSCFERDGLEKIIDDNLDMRCFDKSKYNCWIACVRTDNPHKGIEEIPYISPDGKKFTQKYVYKHIEYFNLKYVKDDMTKKKIILATSAIPFVFPNEEIEGHQYIDGGTRLMYGDNIPVRPLYDIDQCDIILIIHLTDMDESVNKNNFPNARLWEIFPKKNLGSLFDVDGMYDFSSKGAKLRICLGYNDMINAFQNIKASIDREKRSEVKLKDAKQREEQELFIIRCGMKDIDRSTENW